MSILMSPFLVVELSLFLDLGIQEQVYSGILLLQVLTVSPLIELVEHEALAVLDGILTVKSSLGLARPSDGLVVEVDDRETARERSRWVHEVSEIDVWVSLEELIDILSSSVVALDLSKGHEVGDGVVSIFPVAFRWEAASHDIQSDLRVVVNLLTASFDGRNEVRVPNSASVHADDTALVVRPLLRREDKRNGGGAHATLGHVGTGLVESNVASRVDVDAGDGDLSAHLATSLLKVASQQLVQRMVIEDSRLFEQASDDSEWAPFHVHLVSGELLPLL